MTASILYPAITFRLRLPPRKLFLKILERPFTPRTWRVQPPNFAKTHFRRFPIFHAPKKTRRKFRIVFFEVIFYAFANETVFEAAAAARAPSVASVAVRSRRKIPETNERSNEKTNSTNA